MSAAHSGVFDIAGKHEAHFGTIAHAAATATELVGGWRAPVACKVTAVYWTPAAAITGANTNTTHLNFINKGTAGAGSTEVGNKDWTSGVNATAGAPVTITTTAFDMAAGEVLAAQAEKVGTGLDIPSGETSVIFQPS